MFENVLELLAVPRDACTRSIGNPRCFLCTLKLEKPCSKPVVLKLSLLQSQPQGLLKHRLLGLSPAVLIQ